MKDSDRRWSRSRVEEIFRFEKVLRKDYAIAFDRLAATLAQQNDGQRDSEELNFEIKTLLRCFFAHLEALSYGMRRMVIQANERGCFMLSRQEIAELKELKYDRATDSILCQVKLLRPLESFKVTTRYFARLFDSAFEIETSGEGWRGLRRLSAVRGNFTHPKSLEDLSVVNSVHALQPTLVWTWSQYLKLFNEVAEFLRIPRSEVPSTPKAFVFKESAAPWKQFFSDEDYQHIKSVGHSSLVYLKESTRLLDSETLRAYSVCREAAKDKRWWASDFGQFAYRNFVRALSAQIEASISFARFYLEAAHFRGSVHFLPDERCSFEPPNEVEACFASVLTTFSREFGTGFVLPKSGSGWEGMKKLRALRNGLTHPKTTGDLFIGADSLGTLAEVQGYLVLAGRAWLLDLEKVLEKSVDAKDLSERRVTIENDEAED